MIWNKLKNMFNVDPYVITSNKVGDNSPYSFDEKLKTISEYIDPNLIKLEQSPYNPKFIHEMDISNLKVIFCIGQKDSSRITWVKKDGSLGFLQPYISIEQMNYYNQNGYVYIIDNILDADGNICNSTAFRNNLKN